MAKAKKIAALTVGERLEQALVPEGEQPYPVPGNWCWTQISNGFEVTSSKRVHKEDWLSTGVPFYRTRELVKLSEVGYVDNELFISQELYDDFLTEYGVPQQGDILISGVGTIGIPYVIGINAPFYFKDGNIIWFKNKGIFHPKYIFYLYKSIFINNQIHSMSSGTTVDTYTIVNANNTIVPLPPYTEQQRIVDRIESLFAKLDEAKGKAQAALDSFETRKAAILHKAFTGELIQKKEIDTVPLEYIVNDIKIGPFGSALHEHDYVVNGIPLINPKHINNQALIPQYNVTISEEKASELSAYRLRENDIILGRRGEMGRCAPVTKTEDGWLCGTGSMILRLRESYSASFYSSIISSQSSIQYLEEHAVGSTLKNLNEKIVRKIPVPDFSKTEQARIMDILNNILLKEQKAKELCSVLDNIDLIKKAILARAFRGELGTNDPTEESAVELLKRIC